MTDVNVISGTQTIDVNPIVEQTIDVDSVTQQVTVSPATSSISITNSGPVGPSGSSAGYNFTQSSDSDFWIINHNLGYKPSVQTFTVGGLEVIGEVQHVSNNQATVSFNTPISGFARLN